MGEEKTLGAKQVATRIGTDAKTFRKFMRQTEGGVGQGRRYDFPESELPKLAKLFKAWDRGKADPKHATVKQIEAAITAGELASTPRKKLKQGEEPEPSPYSDEDLELDLDDEDGTLSHFVNGLELEDDDLEELEELDFGDDE